MLHSSNTILKFLDRYSLVFIVEIVVHVSQVVVDWSFKDLLDLRKMLNRHRFGLDEQTVSHFEVILFKLLLFAILLVHIDSTLLVW